MLADRFVFLNWMISRSIFRGPRDLRAPTHGFAELADILRHRVAQSIAIEFFGSVDHDDEQTRIEQGKAHDFIRIREMRTDISEDAGYVTLLIEFVDQTRRKFAVVDPTDFAGRELTGNDNERGSFSCHVVIKMPAVGQADHGKYRCVIEVVQPITRRFIETLLARQLKRNAKGEEWSFPVPRTGRRGMPIKPSSYTYYPKLQLYADVGRDLASLGKGDRVLSQLIFTNRKTRQEIGGKTDVKHDDFEASVEVKVNASQAPADPEEKFKWASDIRRWYEDQGYKTKLLYRSAGGSSISGDLKSAAEDGAADLLICPKERIDVVENAHWYATISDDVRTKLIALLDREELWLPGT